MKRKMKISLVIILCFFVTIWILWGNTALTVTEYTLTNSRIPREFEGFRIAQISDLHNAQFGEDNEDLLRLLQSTQPDIIVITGDMIDSRRTDIQVALDFAAKAVRIAPVYYVPGNHESRVMEYEGLKTGLKDVGVTVLENDKVQLGRGDGTITVMGIRDPAFLDDYLFGDTQAVASQAIYALQEDDGFTVLLSHRPELFELYAGADIDLVFSGHAHGGQIRIPFVGGLVAPHQGFFPRYDAGLFSKENTTMVVSRGLGNSIFPIRFHNRPEIVVVELQADAH